MNYPNFYDQALKIQMFDPISDVLGSCRDGIIDYSFIDVVKYTGHGCPTVAGAYMVCYHALKNLYTSDEMPTRGGIEVALALREDEGANGVIGNVFTFLLGAGGAGGFKGLAGQFGRDNLIHYGTFQPAQFSFRRLDNNAKVLVDYHPEHVPGDPQVSMLLRKILQNEASREEKEKLHAIWNERVEKLLVTQAHSPLIYSCRSV